MGDWLREVRHAVRVLRTSPGFTAVAAAMFGVAVAAGLLPARRAVRLDPLVALRRE